LEPFETQSADWYLDSMLANTNMNGNLFRYNVSSQRWVGHPKGLPAGLNDFDLKVGNTYLLHVYKEIEYTFTGRPATSIKFLDGIENDKRIGTDHEFSRSLNVELQPQGMVVSWNVPESVSKYERTDHYNIYRTNHRDKFEFENLIATTSFLQPYITTYLDVNIDVYSNKEYYYLVIPVNSIGREGSSTYSVGVITKTYRQGYNSFALPFRMEFNVTHFFNDNNSSGESGLIFLENNYDDVTILFNYDTTQQKWIGVPRLIPVELKRLKIEFSDGYLIYVSGESVRISFVGR
jgi:hypothetical protein